MSGTNYIKSYSRIVPGRILLNGKVYFESGGVPYAAHDFLSDAYKKLGVDYRKFYKMDTLSKLGFLAAELVLDGIDRKTPKEDIGIAFFNRSASLEADHKYRQTIRDRNEYFPSPSDFVYTLPNIVTGEISIRNNLYGETIFHITPDFRCDRMCKVIDDMIRYGGMKYVLGGWTEVDISSDRLSCFMVLCEAGSAAGRLPGGAGYFGKESPEIPLIDDNLEKLYEKY
ncbi:MAG: hypothetical protein LBH77_07695 [Tannerella sp.]|jgi:uncharacterized protein YqgQ|nr:hypothetical protein [Tannerella sp.]